MADIQKMPKGAGKSSFEFKKIEGPPGPPIKIRLSENEVNKIVTGYNFRKIKTVEVGNFNYMMTFQSI
jgi:hypothetical protein